MAIEPSPSPIRVSCFECPLRHMKRFRPFTEAELEFVSTFKRGELIADPGTTVLVEGARSAHLYTVLSGWGFRYKILEDGRRQILNYVVPGDMIGLQGAVMAEMQHSVEALTPMTLCVFERSRLFSLFELHPGLGFDLTWLAAREECILDEHLLSIGRRSAVERSSYLLAFLFDRGVNAGILGDNHRHIPATQMHFADTLGLSIVHTNKTLKKLADRRLIRWRERGCDIIDPVGLQEIAGWTPGDPRVRPFI